MKTYAICPISDKRINETVARINAILTVLFLVVYVLSSNILIIVFLLFDFILRSAELSKYSPFSSISRQTIKAFDLTSKQINAGPKIFAARIGVVFNIAILISTLSGFNVLALIFTSIFGICAFLEGVFGFCIACQIYPLVYKLFYESKLIEQK